MEGVLNLNLQYQNSYKSRGLLLTGLIVSTLRTLLDVPTSGSGNSIYSTKPSALQSSNKVSKEPRSRFYGVDASVTNHVRIQSFCNASGICLTTFSFLGHLRLRFCVTARWYGLRAVSVALKPFYTPTSYTPPEYYVFSRLCVGFKVRENVQCPQTFGRRGHALEPLKLDDNVGLA